ncbi:MAG: hypothetical protein RL264_2496 [Bacteroidota bacterium]|jgi:hypothetical protein
MSNDTWISGTGSQKVKKSNFYKDLEGVLDRADSFVDLPIDELNKIVFNCIGAIFIQEHTKEERNELLREYFSKYTQHEKPIFID